MSGNPIRMSPLAHLGTCLAEALAEVQMAAYDVRDMSSDDVVRRVLGLRAVAGLLFEHPEWPGSLSDDMAEGAREAAQREVMEHFDAWSGRQHLALVCARAIASATKLLRFDPHDHARYSPIRNWQDLAAALVAVDAVFDVLQGEKGGRFACFPTWTEGEQERAMREKRRKVEEYMDYSTRRGTVLVDAD